MGGDRKGLGALKVPSLEVPSIVPQLWHNPACFKASSSQRPLNGRRSIRLEVWATGSVYVWSVGSPHQVLVGNPWSQN